MNKIRIIEVKESVFKSNNSEASLLRNDLKEKGTFLLNLMSSPGSGKTTLLTKLLPILKKDFKIGVMEADIDSDVDACTINNLGIDVIQLHTGGMCHLDAHMTRQGIDNLGNNDYDFLVLENVGNLVCPAEFDTGSIENMTILSVPEGDDKPLKYPLMYEVCDIVVINKVDVLPYFDFNKEKAVNNILMRNEKAKIFFVSSKTGDVIEDLAKYLKEDIIEFKKESK